MIRNKKLLRATAFFFLLTILFDVFLPSISFALSSNPVAPEFSTFMPDGSSDYVNPINGNFNYSTQVMVLPGSEGDYPINLFYQGGIKLNDDASWTGLGWNINVGAITRNINGFPDDYHGVTGSVADTWSPSADTSYTLNIPLGTNLSTTGMGLSSRYALIPLDSFSTVTTTIYGSLKPKYADQVTNPVGKVIMDSYSQHDPDTGNISSFPDPDKVLGGSYPAYDAYSVSTQGLSGSIEPVTLDNGTLYRKKVLFGTDTIKTFHIEKDFQNDLKFRFKKDFSNSFVTSPNNFSVTGSGASLSFGTNGLGYTYTGPDTTVGFNTSNLNLAGSKDVNWYTVSQVYNGTANGLVYYRGTGQISSNTVTFTTEVGNQTFTVTNQIGAFSITTSSGITYHYALPVYAYDYTKQSTFSAKTSGRTARSVNFSQAYACAWLLTTITGPDFVDRNNNNYADEDDSGSWTNFTYGKKTDNCIFRDPYTGTNNDVDGSYYYTAGRRQLYYLDAAYNRTNCVLFSKTPNRYDAQGADSLSIGGLGANSASPLQLDSILLYQNNALTSAFSTTSIYTAISSIQNLNSNNYLDDTDISDLISTHPSTKSARLKSTTFTYDYSLCPGTINSTTTGNPNQGKLTLTQINFNGQNGMQNYVPPMSFVYELQSPNTSSSGNSFGTFSGSKGTITISTDYAKFSIGDILKITSGINTYYGVLLSKSSATVFNILMIGTVPGSSSISTITQTKNPPYSVNSYDLWGYFKSDYQGGANPSIQNVLRKTSSVSASGVDAWSLRRITTSTGSYVDITYESDSYYDVAYGQSNILNMSSTIGYKRRSDSTVQYSNAYSDNAPHIGDILGDWYQIYFADPDTTGVLSYFNVGQTITLSSIAAYIDTNYGGSGIIYTDTTKYGQDSKFTILTKGVDVRGCYLTISFPQPATLLPDSSESENPLRFPYKGPGDTIRNIFPVGSHYHTTAQHKLQHYGSYIVLNQSIASQNQPTIKYGGGVRVKMTQTTDTTGGDYFQTQYNYTDNFGVTSGAVSYEPKGIDGLLFTPLNGTFLSDFQPQYNQYFSDYIGNFNTFFGATRETPAPSVLYKFVTKTDYGNGVQAQLYTRSYFQVFTSDLIQRQNLYKAIAGTNNRTRTLRIKDFSSRVGNILTTKTYDKHGKLINETLYTYDNGTNIPNNQGILEQVFNEHRIFNKGGANEYHRAMVTVKSTYPSVPLSVQTVDYMKGVVGTVATNQAFDFYTGSVTDKVIIDPIGNALRSKSIPAYTKYSAMGPRVVTTTNQNILSSTAASYIFKVNSSNYNTYIDTMSCGIQTWNNSWNKRVLDTHGNFYKDVSDPGVSIWRPYQTWVWNSPNLNGDGSYQNFRDFNWSGSQATGWQQQSLATRYDGYSNAIEAQDVNSNYSSKKLGFNNYATVTAGANAKYTEIAYSGAEDLNSSTGFFGGEVAEGTGVVDTTKHHTGKASLRIDYNNSGFTYKALIDTNDVQLGRDYQASVWIYDNGNTSAELYYQVQDTNGNPLTGSGSISLATTSQIITDGTWKQLNLSINLASSVANGSVLAIGCSNNVSGSLSAYFDDFKFYPVDFPISAFVYDPVNMIRTNTLDKDNFYMRYTFDGAGKVTATYKETPQGEILLNQTDYNYSNQ